MTGIAVTALSIAMIAVLLLMIFGMRLALRAEHRKQGLLMLVAGVVILANVLIWTM
jgi:hypothetical protein